MGRRWSDPWAACGPMARREIAEALEAARAAGAVPRARKPANIRVTPDGVVEILDLGLPARGSGAIGLGLGLVPAALAVWHFRPSLASPTKEPGPSLPLELDRQELLDDSGRARRKPAPTLIHPEPRKRLRPARLVGGEKTMPR